MKLKALDKKLDLAWSRLVKLRAGNKCEYCGKESPLNSHHIFGRSRRSTRWDVENGCCLCVGHHTFNHKFSAHKAPYEFLKWMDKHKGKKFMENLCLKSNKIRKFTPDEKRKLLIELEKQIQEYG